MRVLEENSEPCVANVFPKLKLKDADKVFAFQMLEDKKKIRDLDTHVKPVVERLMEDNMCTLAMVDEARKTLKKG